MSCAQPGDEDWDRQVVQNQSTRENLLGTVHAGLLRETIGIDGLPDRPRRRYDPRCLPRAHPWPAHHLIR